MITEFKHKETGQQILFNDEDHTCTIGDQKKVYSPRNFDRAILYYLENEEMEYVGDYDPDVPQEDLEMRRV